MTTNGYVQQALAFRQRGFNCCQATVMALADQSALTEDKLYQLASGFGLGMGNMEGVCGALIGAGMIAGLHCEGAGAMRLTRQISERFRELCGGAILCKELKGIGTGKVLCPCDQCVKNAVLAYCAVLDDVALQTSH